MATSSGWRSKSPVFPKFTRRTFLKMIGAVGSQAAVFSALEAWNLSTASGMEAPPPLEGSGEGIKVIVIGAGPAGLVTAYELKNRGYDVTVLEARDRVGGHVYTVRGGEVSEEIGGYPAVAEFAPGNYFDAGAWRVPYMHRAPLYYMHHFNIPLEIHKNQNWNAWVYMEGVRGNEAGQKMRVRELNADMTGYTHELLAKVVDQNLLDLELTEEDHAALLDWVIRQGLLSRSDLTYGPNTSRGELQSPGFGNQEAIPSDPYGFLEVLGFSARAAGSISGLFRMAPTFDQQETMLQPIGGMSKTYEDGFMSHLRENVWFNHEVLEIHQSPNGVWATYLNKGSGETAELHGDYMVCTIPLSVLTKIPADFGQAYKDAIAAGSNYSSVGKAGLQFKRRFWEQDDWIYGGISFTNAGAGTIAYPDYDYGATKGTIQAYYTFGGQADTLGAMHPDERIAWAIDQGKRIHGQVYEDEFETGFTHSWKQTRYSEGGWVGWSSEDRQTHYQTLLEPDGRVYLSGEHLSRLVAWQEGAIAAAWGMLEKIHARAQADHAGA